ncbi:MAG: hypothetical protein LBF84_00725 [Holosporales bacterium]|jgi:hypothetical protein|nr:hypothetical protein [Holosporales bacterium]
MSYVVKNLMLGFVAASFIANCPANTLPPIADSIDGAGYLLQNGQEVETIQKNAVVNLLDAEDGNGEGSAVVQEDAAQEQILAQDPDQQQLIYVIIGDNSIDGAGLVAELRSVLAEMIADFSAREEEIFRTLAGMVGGNPIGYNCYGYYPNPYQYNPYAVQNPYAAQCNPYVNSYYGTGYPFFS